MLEGRLSITEVADHLGVTTKTISRWEKSGKIKPAKRDWRGWRVYSKEDLEEMKSFVETVY
jgi:excisionase family DNA binding protein